MKVSNIIITSLIGGLTLLLLSAALDIRLNGVHLSEIKDKAYLEKPFPLQQISHIIINNVDVEIINHDTNQVVLNFSIPDQVENEAEYKRIAEAISTKELNVSGDTLFIDPKISESNNKINRIKVYVNNKLKSVKGNESLIILNGNLTQNIEVSGKTLFINNSKNNNQFAGVNLVATSTRININATIDSIKLSLNNSSAEIRSQMYFLEAKLNNSSHLNTKEARYHMNIVKDPESKVNIH